TGPAVARTEWFSCQDGFDPDTCVGRPDDDTTDRTYTVVAADAGRDLVVVVTLSAPGGSAGPSRSVPVHVVDPSAAEPPQFTSGPDITPAGTATAGTVLHVGWTASGSRPMTA